jgi:hypothetical protein
MDTNTQSNMIRHMILGIVFFLPFYIVVDGTGKSDDMPITAEEQLSATKSAVARVIERIAGGQAPAGTKFCLKQIRRTGTPLLWEEMISIELGGNSHYTTLRSFVNAGGQPIGSWIRPADEGTVRALAEALLQVKFWEIPSTPIAPGGEENRWECSVQDGEVILSVGGDPGIMMKLSPVEVLLRGIANELVASRSGAALNCLLLIQSKGTAAAVQVALVNEGDRDFQIQNPFKRSDGDINFLRVEVGAAPVAVPGVTGSDIAYRPLVIPNIGKFPAPWDRDCVVIKAGEKVICPFKIGIDLAAHRGHFVRAIYSHYGQIAINADLPLVRGRVFSNETPLR